MSAIPDTSTAGPDIPIILDREVISRLVKGLLSIMYPEHWTGPLSGAAKTKVPVQIDTYTTVLEYLRLPNHWSKFAITQTVYSIMERTPTIPMPRPFAESPDMTAGEWDRAFKAWKQTVIDGIVDRYMGLTTEDYPEGLAPLDMPFWWQKEYLDPKTCLPSLHGVTVRIMRVEG
jgi:hypothetical protein